LKVLDVAGGKDQEATNVQVWKKNGSKAQSWKLVYTSDFKIQTKGLNKISDLKSRDLSSLSQRCG